LFTRARWDRIREHRRLPLVLVVGASLVVVTSAVSAATGPEPGLRFAPGGHWVANPTLGLVFHINGAARTVDAKARVDGLEPASQVVQGDTSGYVVGQSSIVEFGKSTLTVERTLPAPTGERPVAIEAPGGPYLVYREAGSVVRLGDAPATFPTGGTLGDPVATPDGTLWLHRVQHNVICKLPRGADRISCPAAAPAGNTGGLTVVRDRAVFVDTTADTLSPVTDNGLGRSTRLGVDAPPTSRVAPGDVSGRVAILDPEGHRLHLVDGTDQADTPPVTVTLPQGDYAAPTVTRSSVVLLDLRRKAVLTYTGTGEPLRVVPVPPDAGEPSLNRGGDGRVYVDGTEGRHVLVVDHGGTVGQVPVTEGTPSPSASPAPSATAEPPAPPGDGTTTPPAPPRTTGPDRTTGPPRTAGPIPASPPGMPPGLRATVQGSTIVVTWGAAAANGATVTAYHLTWTGGGSANTSGDARSYTISGLTRGATYRITVAAQNSAGRGSPATVQATLPALPTRTVTVSRGRTEPFGSTCQAPDCALMHIELRGFAPNTRYQVNPRSDHPTYTNPGAARTTDSAGNLTFEAFHFGVVGARVWVVVDGVESNRHRWEAG
jgi:hypothetical protein